MPGPWGRSLIGMRLGLAGLAIAASAGDRVGSGEVDPKVSMSAAPGWHTGTALPIAVEGGRSGFEVPTPAVGSRTMVIVSALARGAGPYPIRLLARPVSRASRPRIAPDGPGRGTPARVAPPEMPPPPPEAPGGLPPDERTFHLMVRDGDVASASNYLAVKARLRAVGHRVQVYVDARDVGQVGEELLRDLVTTFDDRVYPQAARHLGLARDVDGDGRFTVLITGWLARLAGGRLAVDGFVRGADLDPDLGAPFGNRCDMMYLSAALAPGPHLRTVLAHEYTHAVSSSLKAFGGPDGARRGLEEEGWLDEALAHLAEDLHGFSRSNLDYRVSAFLSCPERYRLVVDDYYAADLFRSHGNRGSTYLFLRWCADRHGPGLLGTLLRSPGRGVAGLEAATGTPFAALFRQWTIALARDGVEPAATGRDDAFRSLDLRGEIDGWPLAGPRTTRVRPGGPADDWTATGTSCHFAIVEGASTGAVRIDVSGPPEADLQVTAIPLPDDLAGLELSVQALPTVDGPPRARMQVRERDGTSARLTALAWEPLVPSVEPRASDPRRGGLDMLGIASAFGTSALPARGLLASQTIPMTGVRLQDGPLLVKVVGTDAKGRRVAAQVEVPLPANPAGSLAAEGPIAP